jgi:hypothetical protein
MHKGKHISQLPDHTTNGKKLERAKTCFSFGLHNRFNSKI